MGVTHPTGGHGGSAAGGDHPRRGERQALRGGAGLGALPDHGDRAGPVDRSDSQRFLWAIDVAFRGDSVIVDPGRKSRFAWTCAGTGLGRFRIEGPPGERLRLTVFDLQGRRIRDLWDAPDPGVRCNGTARMKAASCAVGELSGQAGGGFAQNHEASGLDPMTTERGEAFPPPGHSRGAHRCAAGGVSADQRGRGRGGKEPLRLRITPVRRQCSRRCRLRTPRQSRSTGEAARGTSSGCGIGGSDLETPDEAVEMVSRDRPVVVGSALEDRTADRSEFARRGWKIPPVTVMGL